MNCITNDYDYEKNLKVIKRIVVPPDFKPSSKSEGKDGSDEKIKIKFEYDPCVPIKKQMKDYSEYFGDNSHVLMALFTGNKSNSNNNSNKQNKKGKEDVYKFGLRIQDGGL